MTASEILSALNKNKVCYGEIKNPKGANLENINKNSIRAIESKTDFLRNYQEYNDFDSPYLNDNPVDIFMRG